MNVNTNTSIMISNQLRISETAISRSLERLATGRRVNSTRDDSAAYSTIVHLDSRIRGVKQANLNVNFAQGLLQTADSAISQQIEIVQRLKELAIQASSETLSSNERSSLSLELNTLIDEFRRISRETEFNGTRLLDGSFGSKSIQIGASTNDSFDLEMGSLTASSVFEKTVGLAQFASAQSVSVGDEPDDFVFADFNGDGIQDMAAINDGADHSLSIRLGNGDGTFGSRTTLAAGNTPIMMQAGDVNGDGIQDIVVLDDTANTVDVYLGQGDGSFASRLTLAITEAISTRLTLVDLDGDGVLDIATGHGSGGQISVLMSNGDGTFADESTIAVNLTAVNHIHGADFNNDGIQDLIATTSANTASGASQVLLGRGDGTFNALSTFAAFSLAMGPGSSVHTLLGDFDNDGNVDLLSAAGTHSSTIQLRKGNGDGTFGSSTDFVIGTAIHQMAVGDFNSDGKLDFVGRNAAAHLVNLGDGAGSFTTVVTNFTATTNGLQVADLNGDGVDDLATVRTLDDAVSVFLNRTSIQSAESDLSLATTQQATKLLGILDTALENLVSERTEIASSLSRLELIRSHNLSQEEAFTNSKNSIEQTDIALETAELVKNQILQQAQISALAQVNIQLQVVLGLFQF